MSSSGIRQIPTGMLEFHGILTESIWLEPQPFWFSIPWNFQQNPMESSGISWNLGASGNGFHWNQLECVGNHWNSHISGEFQWIPTHSNVCLCYYYNIKKVHEQGLNHSLGRCHVRRKQQYIHSAMQLLQGM